MIPVAHVAEAGQMLLKVCGLHEGTTATGRRSLRGPFSDYSRLLILEAAGDPADFAAFVAPRDPFAPLSKLCDLREGATGKGEVFLAGRWGLAWLVVYPNPAPRPQPAEPTHICYLAALPPQPPPNATREVAPHGGNEGGHNGSPAGDSGRFRRAAMSQPRNGKSRTFRILFVIEGQHYGVTPVPADPGSGVVRAYRFRRLDKTAGPETPGEYVCSLSEEGHAACECKGFLRWGHCKHVRTLKAAGMFDLPARPACPEPQGELAGAAT